MASDAHQVPEAYLPQGTYEFAPVVEGTPVAHEFTIQNCGSATLEILDLSSG